MSIEAKIAAAREDVVRENNALRKRVKDLEEIGREVDRAQWKSSAERAHAMDRLARALETTPSNSVGKGAHR